MCLQKHRHRKQGADLLRHFHWNSGLGELLWKEKLGSCIGINLRGEIIKKKKFNKNPPGSKLSIGNVSEVVFSRSKPVAGGGLSRSHSTVMLLFSMEEGSSSFALCSGFLLLANHHCCLL